MTGVVLKWILLSKYILKCENIITATGHGSIYSGSETQFLNWYMHCQDGYVYNRSLFHMLPKCNNVHNVLILQKRVNWHPWAQSVVTNH